MVELTVKEAVGVYLLLRDGSASLDATTARLRKRLEDSLFRTLTVEEFGDLRAFYEHLAPEPPRS